MRSEHIIYSIPNINYRAVAHRIQQLQPSSRRTLPFLWRFAGLNSLFHIPLYAGKHSRKYPRLKRLVSRFKYVIQVNFYYESPRVDCPN